MIPLWFKPAEEFDQFGTFIGILPPLVWGCDPKLYADYSVRKVRLRLERNILVYFNIPFIAKISVDIPYRLNSLLNTKSI